MYQRDSAKPGEVDTEATGCYAEAAGSCAEPEEASVGDAEGLRLMQKLQ